MIIVHWVIYWLDDLFVWDLTFIIHYSLPMNSVWCMVSIDIFSTMETVSSLCLPFPILSRRSLVSHNSILQCLGLSPPTFIELDVWLITHNLITSCIAVFWVECWCNLASLKWNQFDTRYDLFNMALNLVCKCFIKIFCTLLIREISL